MAQVFGALRDEHATHGEKVVLGLLRDNLPKEFGVYVECPLQDRRQLRYPDFIVLTNYGVIILEVKDWVQVVQADRFRAEIRTRGNKVRKENNPVSSARQYAILLASELRRVAMAYSGEEPQDIPWGFAVVLPNLPTSVITQLRQAWGNEFVLNQEDLSPNRITARLKSTLPVQKIRDLRKSELDYIRATINPTVLIEQTDKPLVILDEEQERIVTEPVKTPELITPSQPKAKQIALLEREPEPAAPPGKENVAPDYEKEISQNVAIRLVRGVAGSGKTLVLVQRARYLAAQYPKWNIAVLTYNNQLREHLRSVFKGTKIDALTFHGLCSRLIRGYRAWNPQNPTDWLEENAEIFPIIDELSSEFVEEEIKWIKDIGIPDRPTYLTIERKGRGTAHRMGRDQRDKVYDVLLAYQAYLKEVNSFDWNDVPYWTLRGLTEEKITPKRYDAVLVDEAQDFAPIWFRVVKQVLDPQSSFLFLTDDPSQSIYRFFSWRQKGIHVVGRTRHLRIPYRNTFEIYNAAYSMIRDDEILQRALASEGLLIAPDLDDKVMRHGPRPLLQRFPSFEKEIAYLQSNINRHLQSGVDSQQIVVLHRRTQGVKKLKNALKGLDIPINTFHAYKGLEFEIVFLSQIQESFWNTHGSEDLSQERRLVYMAMTRARRELNMGYQANLPSPWKSILEYVDSI